MAQYATGNGTMVDLGIFPNTRSIAIPNTVAGTTYSVRIQAIGGSTQYSPWSAVISLMST
jgi:anti-sigma-K factor RskA